MPPPPPVAPPPETLHWLGAIVLFLGSGMTWLPSALMSSLFLRSSAHWLLVLQTSGPRNRDEGTGCGGRQVVASGSPVPSGRAETILSAASAGSTEAVKTAAKNRVLPGMAISTLVVVITTNVVTVTTGPCPRQAPVLDFSQGERACHRPSSASLNSRPWTRRGRTALP